MSKNLARQPVMAGSYRTAAKKVRTEADGEAPSTSNPPPLSITRNFIWTLGGTVIAAGCQWAIIVLLAKLASARIVGEFALASAIAVPIAFLSDFRLRVLFVTDAAGKYSLREMLGVRFVLACMSIIVILITCSVARYEFSTAFVIFSVGMAQLLDSVSDNFYGKFQRDERMDRIAKSIVARNFLSATVFTGGLYATHNVLCAVCGLVLGRGLVLLLYDARIETTKPDVREGVASDSAREPTYFGHLKPAWNFRRQLQMLWVALPLAVTALLVSVNGYLPRYILAWFIGRRELGIYAAISYVPSGCYMATIALGYAVFARLSKLFAKGDLPGFRLLLMKTGSVYGGLGVVGFLLSVVAGRQVLTIVYRPEYAEHVDLLRWLMIAGAVQCLTTSMQAGLTAASQFRVQVPLFAGVTAISLIGCVFLVPRMGLVGAAVAMLISSVVQLCASTSLLFRAMVRRAREMKCMECPQLQPVLEVQQ